MDRNELEERISRPRGRPAGKKALPKASLSGPAQLGQPIGQNDASEGIEEEIAMLSEDFASQGGRPSPFSTLLGFLIKNDRSEVLRIAKEVGVSDNTVYRWLNGKCEPSQNHLQRLLNALSHVHHVQPLLSGQAAHRESSRGTEAPTGRLAVQREVFHRVLEQAAISVDHASRSWHIAETIFESALNYLDSDRHGMALTYARLMPQRADGTIHSLCEVEMRGQAPWALDLDFKTYLGSTTLAGAAAMRQRVQTWSCKDEDVRTPVGLDKNELSSCAAPVMRGGHLAGVLIISSALPDFVRNPAISDIAKDYANMLAAGLRDSDFYDISLIKLVPMPELDWQRNRISRSYLNRVVECARKDGLSFPEAEQKVLQDLEEEFELHASDPTYAQQLLDQKRSV